MVEQIAGYDKASSRARLILNEKCLTGTTETTIISYVKGAPAFLGLTLRKKCRNTFPSSKKGKNRRYKRSPRTANPLFSSRPTQWGGGGGFEARLSRILGSLRSWSGFGVCDPWPRQDRAPPPVTPGVFGLCSQSSSNLGLFWTISSDISFLEKRPESV